jgi:hypothetical protein
MIIAIDIDALRGCFIGIIRKNLSHPIIRTAFAFTYKDFGQEQSSNRCGTQSAVQLKTWHT